HRNKILTFLPDFFTANVHTLIPAFYQPWLCLTISIERPSQHGFTQWKFISLSIGCPCAPDMPGFTIAVHFAFHQLFFSYIRQTGSHKLTRENFVVVRMPILFLLIWQRFK